MSTILFVHNHPQPFVRIDLALLSERWTVEERYEQGRRLNPAAVWRAVSRADMVFCWFASWHSLLPVLYARLLKKPAIVVVGGYDTANVPQAQYGSQRGGVRKQMVNTIVRAAAHLIVNSESARRETMANTGAPDAKITMMYHGIAPVDAGQADRQPVALTVGGVWRENLLRKGLLPFVEAAAWLPEWRFVVVGKWYDGIDALRMASGANVELVGYLDARALAACYQRASVYVQASLHEGFGMSLAESMSAGCIPVTTRAGALPEVAGETGVYVEPTAAAIAAGVQAAHQLDRSAPRQRAINLFSIEQRRHKLHELIARWLP